VIVSRPWQRVEPRRDHIAVADACHPRAPSSLSFVPLLTPTTTDSRLEHLCKCADSFLYCVRCVAVPGAWCLVAGGCVLTACRPRTRQPDGSDGRAAERQRGPAQVHCEGAPQHKAAPRYWVWGVCYHRAVLCWGWDGMSV
jgi:hypothetical protein